MISKGINISYLDINTNPGEDFYQFVNGGWMSTTEIPEDRSSWGSFHELSKSTDQNVLSILDRELATPGPAQNKAARLYESGMTITQIEEEKLNDISPWLVLINELKEWDELPALIGKMIKADLGGMMQFSVHPDLGNSKIYAAYLEPGTTGLPEREYYLEEDLKTRQIQLAYLYYIQTLLAETNEADANPFSEKSEAILMLETDLARHMMSKEDRRDIGKMYNPLSYQQLKERYPHWNWDTFFIGMDIKAPEQLIVTDTEYFDFLDGWIGTTSLEEVKAYLTFLLIHQAAPFAHKKIEDAHFNLYGKTIEGIISMRPRHERIVKVINSLLGEALGELFVSRFFPPAAKQTAQEMVADIVNAYTNRIQQLDWMTSETKQYAIDKLKSMRVKIGYPDVWKNYDSLEFSSTATSGSYLGNIIATASWKRRQDMERIGKEVDRDEWFMAPQVVNAYYNPMFNEIVFPAAILQNPFFDWEADAAVNYGGIGAVIGHEITHGFDDQGSRFDKEGNYNEWWTSEDREKFKAHTQNLVRQFDEYYPFEDLALNGTFTLGENIADLGGLSVAYDALQLYFKRHGRPDPIEGFSPEQRFFMSWATVWRTKIRPEALRNQIKTDPHPPGRYRAIAPASNMDSFYEAFPVQTESPWYRKMEERIKIW